MDNVQFDSMVAGAKACIGDSDRAGVPLRPDGSADGRFVLFHAAMSFCSQKVRATLSQRGAAYESNEMLILASRDQKGELVAAENYGADYVRLRRLGQVASTGALADGYSGMSSVSMCGLDFRLSSISRPVK